MTSDDLLRTIKAQIDAHFSSVPLPPPPPPPPVEPPPPPVTGPHPPPRVGLIVDPEITGKGNPVMVNNIPANCVVSYRHIPKDAYLEFRAAGQSFNGTPPETWAWVSLTAGGDPITPYERVSGQSVAVCSVRSANKYPELWFNEQPSGPCNRYAQVN